MKSLVLCIALFFSVQVINAFNGNTKPELNELLVKELPSKTVCIKHPMANDASAFFSTTLNLFFEVYQPGTKADFITIIDKLKSIDGVQNVTPGVINGDYYGINLTLKDVKDKAWFVEAFKKAGLGHVKINNNEAVPVEKL
jgi:hypothetical protein